jgi:hypothetical protein
MMQTITISYVGSPTIPAGMTVAEYRRSRPRHRPFWQRWPLLSLHSAKHGK